MSSDHRGSRKQATDDVDTLTAEATRPNYTAQMHCLDAGSSGWESQLRTTGVLSPCCSHAKQ